MEMRNKIFNSVKEAQEFVNSHGIRKDQILELFQDKDKSYVLVYFEDGD